MDQNSPTENSSSQSGQDSDPEEKCFQEWLRWFRETDIRSVVAVRKLFVSIAIVGALCLVLFAISGVWPPITAISSPSMEPAIERGDVIFLMDEQRFVPDAAIDGTGVATYRQGRHDSYEKFGKAGDVILYKPAGKSATVPIIHRARFWVENGENWYRKANPLYLSDAESCTELRYCPAPHAGFITKGDANSVYDQVAGISPPVRPSWIRGTAEENIPWLGHLRLFFSIEYSQHNVKICNDVLDCITKSIKDTIDKNHRGR